MTEAGGNFICLLSLYVTVHERRTFGRNISVVKKSIFMAEGCTPADGEAVALDVVTIARKIGRHTRMALIKTTVRGEVLRGNSMNFGRLTANGAVTSAGCIPTGLFRLTVSTSLWQTIREHSAFQAASRRRNCAAVPSKRSGRCEFRALGPAARFTGANVPTMKKQNSRGARDQHAVAGRRTIGQLPRQMRALRMTLERTDFSTRF